MTEERPAYDHQPPKPLKRAMRCEKCDRLIAVGFIKPGSILEIKCRCNHLNILKSS